MRARQGSRRVLYCGMRRQQVLIVEDNADQAATLRALLDLKGHHLEVAPDGRAAIEMARRRLPDVVLLDIGLPGLDGFQVARQLKSEYGAAVRIIAVSAYGS